LTGPPTPGWFSLHGGHSGEFCAHAVGALEDIVARAAELGCSCYGVTEHAPRFGDWDLDGDERALGLSSDDLERRWASLASSEFPRLRRQLAGRLALFLGLETDTADEAAFVARMRELARRYRPDYLVASVHHVRGRPIDGDRADYARAADACGGGEALGLAYYELQSRAIDGLRPLVVAHMDLIRHPETPQPRSPRVRAAVLANLDLAARRGCLLEVNASPLRAGESSPYPHPWILEEAQRRGVRATLADDAHTVDEVGDAITGCIDALRACGYREAWSLRRLRDGSVATVPLPIDELAA
jgi:histidinol-phosphatase (PHP family)